VAGSKRVFDVGSLFSDKCSLLGPFKVNGVPLKRVNQAYVIATSTNIDISSIDVSKFEDKYFMKEKTKKVKKTEGEFFKSEEEVCSSFSHISCTFNVCLCISVK
jgi:large subunit ribosomal protein L6e